MNSLANYFRSLREAQDLSLEAIAKRAGVNRTTIWKIENGKPIRPMTMREIATRGLLLKESSKEYADLVALWVVSRGLSDEPQPAIAKTLIRTTKAQSKALTKNAETIATAIQGMRIVDQKAIIKALSDKDAQPALIALARHYAE